MNTLLVLFVGLAITSSSFAQSTANRFSCSQSYQSVCGVNSNVAGDRSLRIERIQNEFLQHALKEAYQTIDSENPMPEGFSFDEISGIKKKSLRSKVTKIFLADLRSQMDSYLRQNKFPADLKESEIKRALVSAVEKTSLSKNDKEQIKEKIKTIKLIALTEFNSELAPNSVDVLKLYKGCAKDSFVDNAFADENKKGQFVIICPGEMIAAIEFARDYKLPLEQSYFALIMTIGHELGHHFDSRSNPEYYLKLSQDLKARSADLQSGNIEDYMSEISADYWGLSALKISIDSSKLRDSEKSIWQAAALEDLCETEDDQVHPSGRFRIENIAEPLLCGKDSIKL